MRLEQLHQIIEIEKQKSISKAAKALFMAQSSLSGALNSLEEEVGVRLFERTASGVVPTPEGEEVLQLARQIVDASSQILNYGQKNRQLHGEVKLYIAQAYGYLFSDIIVKFKNRFPEAQLNMQVETPDKIIDSLLRGTGNLGLMMWGFLPEQTDEVIREAGLKFETFQSHEMMVYVSQDNRFADNDCVRLNELKNEQFLAYSSSYWNAIERRLHLNNDALVMHDREALKRMISVGDGIAILPDTFSMQDLYCAQGMIKLLPIEGSDVFGKGTDYLLYPAKRRLTLLEQKTLELLRELLKNDK